VRKIDRDIARAMDERDGILRRLDVEAAKAFIKKYGGATPPRLDWLAVLHLARMECKVMSDDMIHESRVYCCRKGLYGVRSLDPNSTYSKTVIDLLVPPNLWMEFEEKTPELKGKLW
jgi:hypothetical protein